MTTPEACGLVIITAATADQGGLYLLDMGNPVRIIDLAKKMIQMRGFSAGSDIPIVYTGLRPGERLHEILVATNEELIPTVQSKIFCVNRRGNLPTLTSITRWMDILECSLKYESSTQLRAHLIEIAWEQESIVLVD
jgi:FlaA1/EpsC-like NDP-sugar epimerase